MFAWFDSFMYKGMIFQQLVGEYSLKIFQPGYKYMSKSCQNVIEIVKIQYET